jgi:hypothetical protein
MPPPPSTVPLRAQLRAQAGTGVGGSANPPNSKRGSGPERTYDANTDADADLAVDQTPRGRTQSRSAPDERLGSRTSAAGVSASVPPASGRRRGGVLGQALASSARHHRASSVGAGRQTPWSRFKHRGHKLSDLTQFLLDEGFDVPDEEDQLEGAMILFDLARVVGYEVPGGDPTLA